jgi:hypothetical protein
VSGGTVRRMTPADLLPYEETARTQDEGGKRRAAELADSIGRLGYQPRKHGGMSGDTRSYPPSSPIELVHEDRGSYLKEGNHRVRALADMAYPGMVPVRVRDLRTRQPQEARPRRAARSSR